MNMWSAVTPFAAAGVGVASTLNPTGQLDMPMPSVITAGDLLMMTVVHHGTNWLTPAAGWTFIDHEISGAIRCEVYWRRATGGEAATVSVLCPQAPVGIGQVNSFQGLLAAGDPIFQIVKQANASGSTGCVEMTGLPEHALVYASIGFQVTSFINPSTSFHNASGDPTSYSPAFTNASGTGSSDLYGNATAGLTVRAGEVLLSGDTGAFTWTQTVATNNAIVVVAIEAEPLPPTAPPNVQPTTATELTSLPDSVTQSVHDLGTTYDVWFKYTALADDNVISFFGRGQDFVTYLPSTRVYAGIDKVIEGEAFINTIEFAAAPNTVPVMVQVTEGITYYFELVTNSGDPTPATLTVEIEKFAATSAPIGSLVIPGDSNGDVNTVYPLSVISGVTDQLIHQFVQGFTHGEGGDVLEDGTVLVYNLDTDTVDRYDGALELLQAHADVPIASVNIRYVRTCLGTDRWWVALNFGASALRACYMEQDGTTGPVHSVVSLGGNLRTMAVANDEATLYYALGGFAAIKRVDLTTDTVTTDLAPANGSLQVNDLLVLADDSVVALYYSSTVKTVQLKIYDPAGATLQTIALGAAWTFYFGFAPRLAQAIDPGQFWFWGHSSSTTPAGQAIFYRIDAATGAILDTIVTTDYQFGVSYNGEIDPPTNLYGISTSCPFWVAREAIDGPPSTPGTIIVRKITQPNTDTRSFEFTAGGGLTPAEFDLAHGEEITYTDVAVGSGYSVEETVVDGYTSEVTVSNGSDAGNISVASGETVIVTFTNITQFDIPDSEVRLIRRLRRAPTLNEEQKMFRYSMFQLDMESGISPITGQGSPEGTVNLRWSNNGGHTWSNLYPKTVGALGRYSKRVMWRKLGAARNRVFEISMSDPVAWVLLAAYLDIEKGNGN